MNKEIIIFNIIYYAVVFILIILGRKDASSSLGYGIFIVIFWIISAALLIFLLVKKIINPKTLLDKIGVLTATPLLAIIVIGFLRQANENISSEGYFNKDGYRYKVRNIDYDDNTGARRIEFYRSADSVNSTDASKNDVWIKDSVWVYLSKTGDTIKKVTYKNDVEVK